MPEAQPCLAETKHDYSVTELEDGYTCQESQIAVLRIRLEALQRAVKRRQQVVAAAKKAASQ